MSTKLHNRLTMIRTEKGMSRKALAERVGVNYQTIGYLERGDYNPSLELAMKICAVFELPVETVFSFTPFPSITELLRKDAAE